MRIRQASWLTFRYTFSTWVHHEQVPAKTIAEMMGHENVTTQFIYVQSADDGAKHEVAKRLTEKLQLDGIGQERSPSSHKLKPSTEA